MNSEYKSIIDRIFALSEQLGNISIMEVCGTHTASIYKYGISDVLPKNIELLSGPGCPVCVTSQIDIEKVISLLRYESVTVCCFGDMLRVPAGDNSLYKMRENGYDVRIITSPLDVLNLAQQNPNRIFVFFAVGFETTAPLTAALLESAKEAGTSNLFVYSAHKTMPNVLRALFSQSNEIDALICPGHVSAITGRRGFEFVAHELNMPAVIAGFGAKDILIAIYYILKMLTANEAKCINAYPSVVREEGNTIAQSLISKVFEPSGAYWRGIGYIENSGLKINSEYSEFDAEQHFEMLYQEANENAACICGEILTAKKKPTDCALFGTVCTPYSPAGACMVSSEGNCASYYKYWKEASWLIL